MASGHGMQIYWFSERSVVCGYMRMRCEIPGGWPTDHLQIVGRLYNFGKNHTKKIRGLFSFFLTTLQSMMNVKLDEQRFWACHENRIIKTTPTLHHSLWVSFKSGFSCCSCSELKIYWRILYHRGVECKMQSWNLMIMYCMRSKRRHDKVYSIKEEKRDIHFVPWQLRE